MAQHTSLSKIGRMPELDGLRGWAALVVLLGHTFQTWLLNPELLRNLGHSEVSRILYSSPVMLMVDGTFAVQLFFVISGAALSIPVLAAIKPYRSVANLALFRYPRLVIPIAASCLLAYLLAAASLYSNAEAGALSKSVWLSSLYQFDISNTPLLKFILFDVFFAYTTTWNAALWTMPIELAGSFAVFALLLLARWRWLLIVASASGSILLANSIYGGFFLGALIAAACFPSRESLRGLGAVSLIGGLAVQAAFRTDYFQTNGYLAMNIAAALIVFGACMSPVASRMLAAAPSRFMGRISFSLYLVHLPIICSASSALYLLLQPTHSFYAVTIAVASFTVLASIGVAVVFNRLVDETLVRNAKRLIAGRVLLETPDEPQTPLVPRGPAGRVQWDRGSASSSTSIHPNDLRL
jgi:peptidoglycan/LPS O-acetylase OafA/YrhL